MFRKPFPSTRGSFRGGAPGGYGASRFSGPQSGQGGPGMNQAVEMLMQVSKMLG